MYINKLATTAYGAVIPINKRNIAAFVSNNRRNISSSKIHKKNSTVSKITYGQTELDTHADSIVAGSNCCIMHYTNRECDVSPYRDDYEPIKMVRLFRPPRLLHLNIQVKPTF